MIIINVHLSRDEGSRTFIVVHMVVVRVVVIILISRETHVTILIKLKEYHSFKC